MTDVLRAQGLTKCFGDHTVLDDVDLHLSAGKATALIGANGAGKTTLLKLLVRRLAADRGQILLKERNIDDLSRRQIACQVAVVPQQSPQIFGFTLLEFVLMGTYAAGGGFVAHADDRERAQQALEQVSLTPLKTRPVSALSGGEYQRALLARAIVADVPVWLLDEPTSGLDMNHQIATLKQVRRKVEQGGAVLAILHDLALVHRFFDRVIVLDDASIVAAGPPDTVLTVEVVSRLYGVPMICGEVQGHRVWIAR